MEKEKLILILQSREICQEIYDERDDHAQNV